MNLKKIFFLGLLFLVLSQHAHGDFYNFRNHLIGERGALMGGAYTALSEDISGSYYNNAGLAFVKRKALSMNGSVYSYQDYTQKLSVSGVEVVADYQKFFIVPTTIGISLPFENLFTFSVALFEVDRVSIDTTVLTGASNLSFKVTTDNYLLGPSIATKISDHFAVGLSIFYHLFQFAITEKSSVDLGGGNRSNEDIQDNGNSGGFVLGLGFKGYINSRWQVGFMYTSQTLNTNGEITYTENKIETATPSSSTTQGKVKGDVRLPHRIVFGVAYEEKQKFAFALDFTYYFELDYKSPRDYLSDPNNPSRHLEEAHFDISLGGEVYITEAIALRAGFFTNTSSAPDKNTDKIHMFGGTFGVAHVKDGLSSGIGIKFMYGNSSNITELNGINGHWRRFQFELILGSTLLF